MVAAGTQNLLQCTPNINKQCLLANAFKSFFSSFFFVDLTHLTAGTWSWKFINSICNDNYLRRKQQAEWGLTTGCEEAASETLIMQQTHDKTLQVHLTRAIFVIVLDGPRWRRTRPFIYLFFLQADISLKRYCPWKIWPFISMIPQINNPKSTTLSRKRYVQHRKDVRGTQKNLVFRYSVQSGWR